jgi:hypothetical protein
MGIEEDEEVQAKGIGNLINKVEENFPNLEDSQVQEASRTPDMTKIEPLHGIL